MKASGMPQPQGPDELQEAACKSLQQAVEFCFGCQRPDGHWVAEVSADATFTAQYVMFKYAISGLSIDEDSAAIQKWLLADQTSDGSWVLAPGQGLPGNISTTVEAYLALRILGTPTTHPAMERARDFVIRNGGVEKVRFFTRFFLATFGLLSWTEIPQMPAELILLPTWAILNIYVLSSWSRSTLIPILVVRHHEPVYALPNGRSTENDFIDELWLNPGNKHIPYAPALWESLVGRERDLITFGFTLADKMLSSLGGLRRGAVRKLALRRCIEWLFEHQEESGDWAGFFPPIHGSIWALILEGYSLDHKAVRLGLEALERLAISDDRGKWIQATVSPCWDTGLAVSALADASVAQDARVSQAVGWLRDRQLMNDYGDWRVYAATQQAGGWSFEYFNTVRKSLFGPLAVVLTQGQFYPDVDDTAVVVMALVKQDPSCIDSPCISNAVEWILGMQNHDGGWGAFDTNNDAMWLHKVPFSDMDSLVDPSSADITGRMLECFGLLLAQRKGGRISLQLGRRLWTSADKAISYLVKEQEAFGGWWGRWGNNYNYGTTNVLRGLVWFAPTNPDAHACAERAVHWLEECQNEDGGWGESLLSYTHKHLAGCGQSTAAQTAWALDSLLRFRPVSTKALRKGAQWLVNSQVVTPQNGRGASWSYDLYVGTGFPHVLYLGYPFYHHFFPIQALARYIKSVDAEKAVKSVEMSAKTTEDMNRPAVLMIAMGSREDIEPFLNIGKKLTADCRVRIATHSSHQQLVRQLGFDFHDVGGSPDEVIHVLNCEPLVHQGVVTGSRKSYRLLQSMYSKFWDAGTADPVKGFHKIKKSECRPFVADVVVSAPIPTVNVHIAEALQIPMVVLSDRPTIPTKEFPHPLTMTNPSLSPGHWWNLVSYFMYDLFVWLTMGRFLNGLRATTSRMRPLDLTWATRDFVEASTIYIGLWSSAVVTKPRDWNMSAEVAGYSFGEETPNHNPPAELERFLGAHNRTIAINLEVASVPEPRKFLTTLKSALECCNAGAVVCGTLAEKLQSYSPASKRIYLAKSFSLGSLLKRVDGVIHNGSAGQTAEAFRAGVPQLVMPQFQDQFFWAGKVQELGVGPKSLRPSRLTDSELAAAIDEVLSGTFTNSCATISDQVQSDKDGASIAAAEIKRQANQYTNAQACGVIPSLPASWKHIESGISISGAVAACLVHSEVLAWDDLDLVSRFDWKERWQQAESKFSWLHLLRLLNVTFVVLHQLIHRSVMWLRGDAGFPEENMQCRRMRDPVRRARIRQADFDWTTLRREAIAHRALDDAVVQRWEAVSIRSFQERFANSSSSKNGLSKTEPERADSVLDSSEGEEDVSGEVVSARRQG